MKNTEKAFKWIVGILRKHDVPFIISGGFAAKIHGATRPLNDIDIDIPDSGFPKILADIRDFITYGPARFIDERWDLNLITLNFEGQEIDIGGGDSLKICDARTGKWQENHNDFSAFEEFEVFGLSVPVIKKEDLITYKSMLEGDHQKRDIEEVLKSAQVGKQKGA